MFAADFPTTVADLEALIDQRIKAASGERPGVVKQLRGVSKPQPSFAPTKPPVASAVAVEPPAVAEAATAVEPSDAAA